MRKMKINPHSDEERVVLCLIVTIVLFNIIKIFINNSLIFIWCVTNDYMLLNKWRRIYYYSQSSCTVFKVLFMAWPFIYYFLYILIYISLIYFPLHRNNEHEWLKEVNNLCHYLCLNVHSNNFSQMHI